jgi:hypothetical protein
MITPEERQKRIDQIEKENQALKELNDFRNLKERVKNEPSIIAQVGIIEESEADKPLKKIATPAIEPSI